MTCNGNANWFWSTAGFFTVYAVLILFFVVRAARRNRSLSDYALGNINFSPSFCGFVAAASTAASSIRGLLFRLERVSGFCGVPAVQISLMTKGFRKQGLSTQALGMGQWIGNRYKSKGFALFFAVLSLLLITFKVLIVVGRKTKGYRRAANSGGIGSPYSGVCVRLYDVWRRQFNSISGPPCRHF